MPIFRSDDPIADFNRQEANRNAWLKKRPVCCHCGHHIQDENIYDIEGNLLHEDCMNERYRKYTEDYIT